MLSFIMLPFLHTVDPVQDMSSPQAHITFEELEKDVEVGDIVFIHIDVLPFRKVARDTGSWTNHVGVIIDVSGPEPVIAESTFPFSKAGPLSRFIKRSKDGRVAISRLNASLTHEQREAIKTAALKRTGIFYDSGFNLYSRRQFCSRYVYEVMKEATGISLGKIENLAALFRDNPKADLLFWRIWYFGKIPWERETVTPASVLKDPRLENIFDGYAS